MKVTVWGYRPNVAAPRYFAALLGRLGYRTRLRILRDYGAYYARVADSRTRAQIGLNGWVADFGAASDFTLPVSCAQFAPRSSLNQNLGEYCDRGIEAQIEAARADLGDTGARWRRIYGRLVDAAPIVPLVNRRSMVLVSKRVGNFQLHPMWGTLLDQLWVR